MAELIHVARPRCEFEYFDADSACRREANFRIDFVVKGTEIATKFFCYRHRWRAYDYAILYERHEKEHAQ